MEKSDEKLLNHKKFSDTTYDVIVSDKIDFTTSSTMEEIWQI